MARKNKTRQQVTPPHSRRKATSPPPEEPRILKADVQPMLRRIVSMLDLTSYSRLRRTCRQLLTLSPADERPIKVRARCEHSLTVHYKGVVTLLQLNHWNAKRYADICTLQTIRKAISCGLMEIEVDEVDFRMPLIIIEEDFWKKTEKRLFEFLRFVGVKKVSSVDPEFFYDFQSLCEFITEFKVKMLRGFWRMPTSHLKNPEFQKSIEFLMLTVEQERLEVDPTAWDFLIETRIPFVSVVVEAPLENQKTSAKHWPFAVEVMEEWWKMKSRARRLKAAEENPDVEEENEPETSPPGSFETDSDGDEEFEEEEELEEYSDDSSGTEGESDEDEEEMEEEDEEEVEEESESDDDLDTSGSFVEDPDDPPKEEEKTQKREKWVHNGFPLESFKRLLETWSKDPTRLGVSLRFSHHYTRNEFFSAFTQFPPISDEVGIESPNRPLYSYNKMWDCHYVVREDGEILCCWSNKDKERRRIIEVMQCDRTMIPLELVPDAVQEVTQKEKVPESRKKEKEAASSEEATPRSGIEQMIKWCAESMNKNVRFVDDKGLLARLLKEELERSRLKIEVQSAAETMRRCEVIRRLNLTLPFIRVMVNEKDPLTNEKHPLAAYLFRKLDRRSFYALTSSCQALRYLSTRRETVRIFADRTPTGAPAVVVHLQGAEMPMSVPALVSLQKAIQSKRVLLTVDVVCSGYDDQLGQMEEQHFFQKEKSDFGHLGNLLEFLQPTRIKEIWHMDMFKHHFDEFVKIVKTFHVQHVFGTWPFRGSAITHPIFKELNCFSIILTPESLKRIREEYNEVKFVTAAWNKTGIIFCAPGQGFDEKTFRAVMKEAINGKMSIIKFVFAVLITEDVFLRYFSNLPAYSEKKKKKSSLPSIRPVVLPTPTVTAMQAVSHERKEEAWRTVAIARKDNSIIYCSFTEYGPFGNVRLCTRSA